MANDSPGGGSPARAGPGSPLTGTRRSAKPEALDVPSTKYRDVEMPSAVVLRRAQSPPRPTLPRRPMPKTWTATMRERNPLTSSLTGAHPHTADTDTCI